MAAWGSGYKYAFTGPLPGGQFGSIAMKHATDPAEIYFKSSVDGATWPADVDAILAAEISGAGVSAICTFAVNNEGTIFLTNGVDILRVSNDNGLTWANL